MRWRSHRKVLSALLPVLLAICLPFSIFGNVNVNLTWNANTDPNVTGYNIYYGTSSQSYSYSNSVGPVTATVISNIPQNTSYFFAATARSAAGQESALSTPIAFLGTACTPDTTLKIKALPKGYTHDALTFSLDATAPAGASINPTNGTFSWMPGRSKAATTNLMSVNVTDAANPAMNITESLMVIVSDYLEFRPGHVAVATGGTSSLPLTVASSSSITNVQITLNWPGSQLQSPTLTFFSPVVSGSMKKQGSQLVIQLQTAANQPLVGTNVVGQVNFQAASGQPTTVLSIPIASASGSTAAGVNYANVLTPPGEVVVVGSVPMLRPQVAGGSQRTISLYALPGTYTLLYTTSLATPVTWTPLTTYAQTNVFQTVALDPTIPNVYYRLHQL